jgi:DNA-binding winged helix-turn-helix (wHTH) protein
MENDSKQRLFRFGAFEVDRQTSELRKQGRRLPLQGQPFEILLMLLERRGELVPRAEIQQKLWPEGTFVDFDHSLNTAVNKIRDVLGDSAVSPRFIETLARRGYRFVAPVEEKFPVPGSQFSFKNFRSPEEQEFPPSAKNAEGWGTQVLLGTVAELPETPHRVVRVLFFLLQVMYFFYYVVALARLHVIEELMASAISRPLWVFSALIVTAVVGIPIRVYLMTALAFNAPGLREKFLRLFAVIFPLDELWALAPFLLVPWIGWGLALASTAILLYVPFAERSLILMGAGDTAAKVPPI